MTVDSITAVLPTFNEEAVIADVVTRTIQALKAADLSKYEVLVVNDGSSDGTVSALKALAQPAVRVLSHSRNRGYGAALRSGFEAARSEAVWLMDSDGQFNPEDLRLLSEHYSDDVVVAGYRIHRRDSRLRRLYHNAFFGLVGLLFGRTTRDVNCAFKLFPRAVGVGLTSQGAMISTELLLRAKRCGYRIVDVPVPHYPRRAGRATGARISVVARAFWELIKLRINAKPLRTLKRPVGAPAR